MDKKQVLVKSILSGVVVFVLIAAYAGGYLYGYNTAVNDINQTWEVMLECRDLAHCMDRMDGVKSIP